MSTNPNQIVKPNFFLKISSPEKRGPSILLIKFEIRAICFKDISKYSIILIFCLWKRSQRNGPYVSCCVNTLEWLIWWLTKYCPRSPTVGQHEKEMLETSKCWKFLFTCFCTFVQSNFLTETEIFLFYWIGQYVKQTDGAVGNKTFQYWWNLFTAILRFFLI